MKTFPKWLKGILLAALTSTALAGCNSNPILGLVPEEWYLLPEKSNHTPNASSKEQEAALGKHVDLLFQTQGQALATLPELTPDQAPLPAGHPADWVPWHLEYLMTDLSVSASGVLGSLTLKGTPDITAMWRRQYTPGRESTPPNANDVSDSAARADLVVNETTRASDIAIQLEPAINAAVLSGKVKDEKRLRENLTRVAGEFRDVALQLAQTPQGEWWVSRFRLDATADASGTVTPNISVGADVRFRFEWHRMMRPHPAIVRLEDGIRVNPQLDTFVRGMIRDLQEVTVESEKFKDAGLKAYGFRVGVGFTAGGTIGLAKATGTLTGQIYFSRDVKKPTVNPHPPGLLARDEIDDNEEGVVSLVDDASSPELTRMAIDSGAAAVVEQDSRKVEYKLDRKKFRAGLKQATAIGGFFAKRVTKVTVGHWKVYEFRTAFDVSFTGKVGMTTVGGVGTAEINFWNQNF